VNTGDGEIPPNEFGGISRGDRLGISPGLDDRLPSDNRLS
jgi:hypothetical protein